MSLLQPPCDNWQTDWDCDGIGNDIEGWPVVATGQTNDLLDDSDGDGIQDHAEDIDRDGVVDAGETDPRKRDSDGDGLMDGIERYVLFSDPLDPGIPASYSDADGDGLPVQYDPDDAAWDTDGDRYADAYEAAVLDVTACTDPARVPPLGDVNLDGAVSNADALAVQALFLTKIGPDDAVFQWRGFRYADPSRDGHISNMDALMLQTFFLGRLEVLPRP